MSSYIAYLQPMILFFYQCCCPHPKVHLLTTFRHQKLSQCHIPNVIDFILDLYQQHPELLCQTHDILTHHLFIHCTMLNLPPMIHVLCSKIDFAWSQQNSFLCQHPFIHLLLSPLVKSIMRILKSKLLSGLSLTSLVGTGPGSAGTCLSCLVLTYKF